MQKVKEKADKTKTPVKKRGLLVHRAGFEPATN
jgi:hypothetical protein